MRPVARPQSALRAPLNHILGTEANVRVLRILAELKEPIGAPDLARRSALQRSSVHRALKDLEAYGIVSFIGVTHRAAVVLRAENPLTKALRSLFVAERGGFEALLTGLRETASSLKPPPLSVWLEGPVATGADKPGDPIVVGVLAGARDGASIVETLSERTRHLGSKLDLAIEFRGHTRADLDALDPDEQHALLDAIPIVGVPPAGLIEQFRALWQTRNLLSHSDLDRRSASYGEQIANALRRDKSLIDAALDFVSWRLRTASDAEKKELREWQRLLRPRSTVAIKRALTDTGERATRLRQTNPFVMLGRGAHDPR